jgi:hypothetical protein
LPIGKTGLRKDCLIEAGIHDGPAVARQLIRELLPIAHADDVERRILAEKPGGKRNRRATGFEIARRQIDDQPPDLTATARLELLAYQLDVRAADKGRRRAELVQCTFNESP